MKKLIALLLAVSVLFSLALTGCKSETPDDIGDNETAASGKDPDRLIKIGFVFSAIVSTDAWSQTSENARLYLEENCQNVETYKVENIAGGADCERVMREYINDGCETAKNMSVYIAKLEQGRYMTGLLAGKMTKVNKIGYVSSIPFPDPIKQLNGFAVGVAEANPDAEIVTLWANSFNDPTADAVCANTLIDQGCDLICIDLSSSAVAQVCESRGVMFIGSSVDMREFAPTQQLTSNCWTWGPWMAEQVEAVRNGTFVGKWCELDINDGAISLAEFSDKVPQDVRDLVADAEKRLREGFEVFAGPLYDNTGKLRVAEGEVLSTEDANAMQWFLPNVIDNWADKPTD